MPVVRVIAVSKEGGHAYKDHKVVVLCQINERSRISDGEWFGFVKNETISYPFVLQKGERLFYGYDEHSYELTNIGTRTIAAGEYFTIRSAPGSKEEAESVYEITSVHRLEG